MTGKNPSEEVRIVLNPTGQGTVHIGGEEVLNIRSVMLTAGNRQTPVLTIEYMCRDEIRVDGQMTVRHFCGKGNVE